ncbi:MAG: sugar ABC transporter ATP-binding protein [Planctomycetota bacterium]
MNITFKRGTVHALVGENGAGKSTLMKILAGLYPKYGGSVLLHGHPMIHGGVRQALDAGISMIHQELMYVPHMTVADNVLLGKEPASRVLRRVDTRQAHRQTAGLLQQVGLDLDPDCLMKDLSVAERQMVEIAKAISYDAEIIIMDEPSSALSQREVQRLFTIIADLKRTGVTVIYISHKLDEVFQIAEEVTVLRDGQVIGTHAVGEVDADGLIALMVGRKLAEVFPARRGSPGDEILSVRNLTREGVLQDVCFSVCQGEILGLAGLMGAGRTEVIRCLFGLDRYDRGQIFIEGREVAINSPADALRLGLGLVSEDRQITGLVPCLSLGVNVTLPHLNRCSRGPVIVREKERQLVDRVVGDLRIKSAGSEQSVSHLSGGNQQKVVLAKALLGEPDILILDEPTRGIDVGTKAEIYALMRRLADEGKAIVMASSELPEVMGMSDRIVVLSRGRVTGRLRRDEACPEAIMRYAMVN